jgi:hypothetical protein
MLINEAPLVISGQARGSWFFEAQFSADLVDTSNTEFKDLVLGRALLTAKDDWMTSDFVPFEGRLHFDLPRTASAALVFKNANMSGLPENDKIFKVPLVMRPEASSTVRVFFANKVFDPKLECTRVYAVNRTVPYTKETARYSLIELLRGLTPDEEAAGYLNAIDKGVGINSLRIQNNTIYADLTDIPNGGSCRVGLIRSQLEATLRQFPNIQRAVISLNGNDGQPPNEPILQP